MPSNSQPPSGYRPQGRSNTNGSSLAPSSTGATAGSSRGSSVVGQPNAQRQPAQAGSGQAGSLANGGGGLNGNSAGNGGGNAGGNGSGNRAADFWDPALPGENEFGYSSPGEGFGGPSRRYTVVEPRPNSSPQRAVVHNYPNGAANRSAANGGWLPCRK